MKGIIKRIKNGIYIHEKEGEIPTIDFHTVAELDNGGLVDLTDIMKMSFGKTSIGKRAIRKLNSIKVGQIIDYYYDKDLCLNIPVLGIFSINR